MPVQPEVVIEGLSPSAAAAVVKLSKGMANSKDMNDRVQFYELARKNDPGISIPPDVQMEQFRREQAADRANEAIEREKQSALDRQAAQRAKLAERYDEATIKKIEDEVMTTRCIGDYEIAATIYASQNPEPNVNVPERTATGSVWTMPWEGKDKGEVAELMRDPRKMALKRAHAVVGELRKKRA
jgi:hypothetical protein